MNTERVAKTLFWRTPTGLVLCGLLAIGVLLVLLKYEASLLSLWSLLILLVCGGMHFMHRGHGARSWRPDAHQLRKRR
jgi:hypothetical protein